MLKNSELGEKAVLKRSTRRLSEHLSNINQLKIAKQNEKLQVLILNILWVFHNSYGLHFYYWLTVSESFAPRIQLNDMISAWS